MLQRKAAKGLNSSKQYAHIGAWLQNNNLHQDRQGGPLFSTVIRGEQTLMTVRGKFGQYRPRENAQQQI